MDIANANNNCARSGPDLPVAEELRRLLQSAGMSFSAGQTGAGDIGQDILGPALQAVNKMTGQARKLQDQVEGLSSALANSTAELALLHRVNDHMKGQENPQTALANLIEDIRKGIDAELVMLLRPQEDETGIGPVVLAAAGQRQLQERTLQLIWDRTEEQDGQRLGYFTDNDKDGDSLHQWPENIANLISVPLEGRRGRVGVLAAITERDFDTSDTQTLLSAANQMAIYLANSQLYRDLEELLLGALRALTSSIDAKDTYTCGHSERVAMISRCLAEWLGIDSSQVNTVHLTGLLHDVGKIGVSELVLTKPGRLADDEFDQIKKHPRIGADILKGIKQMAAVARGVLTHHERYDGAGYPDGLTGETIPLAGRIVMLADSLDAMISDRTYRKAMPVLAALAEIRRFSGTQFDPDVADALLSRRPQDLLDALEASRQATVKLYHTPMV